MENPKNTRVSLALLIVALVALALLVFVATRINRVENSGAPLSSSEHPTIAADPGIVIDPLPEPTPTLAEGPLVGMPFVNENCAVELVLSNDAATDAIVSIQVETTSSFDELEDVIPAQGMLNLTLVRDEPVTYVYVVETSGAGEAIISWAPDYATCDNAPATTGGTDGGQPSEQPEAERTQPPVTMI